MVEHREPDCCALVEEALAVVDVDDRDDPVDPRVDPDRVHLRAAGLVLEVPDGGVDCTLDLDDLHRAQHHGRQQLPDQSTVEPAALGGRPRGQCSAVRELLHCDDPGLDHGVLPLAERNDCGRGGLVQLQQHRRGVREHQWFVQHVVAEWVPVGVLRGHLLTDCWIRQHEPHLWHSRTQPSILLYYHQQVLIIRWNE